MHELIKVLLEHTKVRVNLLAKSIAVELIEHRLVEPLTDTIGLRAFHSIRKRDFHDFATIRRTVEEVLQQSPLPLIIEGSTDQAIDSEVFAACGGAGEGERLLLGTAESGRYRSIAAAALAYGHAVIAQSPIDINLAKQLNILLRETGVPADRIVRRRPLYGGSRLPV